MPREILWTEYAEEDLKNLLEYLSRKWNNRLANEFISILDDNLERIINNPDLFPYIHKEMLIRRCVLTKQNTL